MKKAQLIVLAGAIAAAGGAGYIAMGLANKEPEKEIIQAAAPMVQTDKVLVASTDIPMGSNVNEDMLVWQDWPVSLVPTGAIVEKTDPKAFEEVVGSIARSTIYSGEPIRNNKLVNSKQGFMSAILPKGQRAVATSISTATSAGGFILPNDRVDVLMTKRRTGEGRRRFFDRGCSGKCPRPGD